ncbi:NrdH-redoxin [Candidatus Peregrinibacteria bacterium CG10_big_fil_rev_8_21_14_0_10_54_7]|nr:MAG: NrdH-redoxin [Candidatus Peregrinibacteria bacterium CG10_big_fil_rev_8_21_14_0_10_54_7]
MSIDLYTTPTCGYCMQLKVVLQEKKIAYSAHDITTSEKDFNIMQEVTNGCTSVPVTVIDKGTPKQQVAVGFDDAMALLKLS